MHEHSHCRHRPGVGGVGGAGPGTRRALRPLVLLLAAGLVVAVGAGTAAAQPSVPGAGAGTAVAARPSAQPPAPGAAIVGADATVMGGGPVDSPAAVRAVLAYWTPERMRTAVPAPDPVASPAIEQAMASMGPTGSPGSTPSAPPGGEYRDAAGAQPPQPNGYRTVGKAFFVDPVEGDVECSAAALNSPSKRLVITAAHCVRNGGSGGAEMRNWIFVPGWDNGAKPHGEFAAVRMYVLQDWASHGDIRSDVGMVVTAPSGGKDLVTEVGGYGITYNQPRLFHAQIWGYPDNRNHGLTVSVCTTQTREISVNDRRPEAQCAFGEGGSGGPWIKSEGSAQDVNGITHGLLDPHWNVSSYFSTAVYHLWQTAGSVT